MTTEGPGWILYNARWQDVLRDVAAHTVITDTPYSEATTSGQTSIGMTAKGRGVVTGKRIGYGFITRPEVATIVAWAHDLQVRWLVSFGDHISAEWFRREAIKIGWRSFPPVLWCKTNAAPRFACDGPSPQHETIAVSRPRRRMDPSEMFYRAGWYAGKQDRTGIVTGGKPLWLVRALVRHYSRPGDTIVDPTAGGGTTLLAAVMEGRRAIGAECDPDTYEKAVRRLREGYTQSFPGMPA